MKIVYTFQVACGKCVKEKIDAEQSYTFDEVKMEYESEDGSVFFFWCPRGHDTKVELHHDLELDIADCVCELPKGQKEKLYAKRRKE